MLVVVLVLLYPCLSGLHIYIYIPDSLCRLQSFSLTIETLTWQLLSVYTLGRGVLQDTLRIYMNNDSYCAQEIQSQRAPAMHVRLLTTVHACVQ